MNVNELQERIDRWEDLHTEFKQWPVHPDDLAAAIVAFANTDGGQLIIGVDKNRTALGVENADRVTRDVDEEAMKAGVHIVRNPRIYSRLSDAGLVTRAGTGVRRIIRLVKEATGREAEISIRNFEVLLTIPRKQNKESERF